MPEGISAWPSPLAGAVTVTQADYLSAARARLEAHSIPEPNSGCRLWLKYCNPLGYGVTGFKGIRGRLAHRVAWELARGPIPEGLLVCHKCDVPSCINVDHLWLGTNADNVADRDRKRRGGGDKRRAERNGKAKLSEALVRRIRADARFNWRIAAEVGLCEEMVARVKRREIWRHVT